MTVRKHCYKILVYLCKKLELIKAYVLPNQDRPVNELINVGIVSKGITQKSLESLQSLLLTVGINQ